MKGSVLPPEERGKLELVRDRDGSYELAAQR
jgi:hypothetical protein